MGLQQLIRSSLFSFILLVIGSASVVGLAATSAAMSLYQLLSIPAIGLATAVTVVTGQAYSSGGMRLAGVVIGRAMVVGMFVAITVAGSLLVFPDALLQIQFGGLEPSERNTIEPLAITLLGYAAVYGLADIAGLVLGASIKGIGRTFIILVATAIPGVACVAGGWWLEPTGEAAVTHWWLTLVTWAALQASIIGVSVLRICRDANDAPARKWHKVC